MGYVGRARMSVAAGDRRAKGEFMFVIAAVCPLRGSPDIQWDTSPKVGNQTTFIRRQHC